MYMYLFLPLLFLQKADAFLMIIVNSLAILYLYNQFSSLRKAGSKYLLGMIFILAKIHSTQCTCIICIAMCVCRCVYETLRISKLGLRQKQQIYMA